jgi:hypothetical protein
MACGASLGIAYRHFGWMAILVYWDRGLPDWACRRWDIHDLVLPALCPMLARLI